MHTRKREKTFGPGHCIPLDGNAKARIKVFVQGYNAKNRQGRQHRGPITRAYFEVFEALLFGFHNSKSGRCFPSYETIAEKAKCCRDTVYEAIKVLEDARVLTWVHRITRIQVRERDLFGKWQTRRQVIRTSNAYVFRDPIPGAAGRPDGPVSCKSEIPTGTLNQEDSSTYFYSRRANLHLYRGSHQGVEAAAVSERDRQAAIAALGERQRVIQARLLTKGH